MPTNPRWCLLNKDHTTTPTDDMMVWAANMEANRRVALTEIRGRGLLAPVEVEVSTVFVGIMPLPFESMIFGGPLDQTEDRYATWAQAIEGHAAMVARVKALRA